MIRKTGNDTFIFPTGDNSTLRPIGISAPTLVSDHFTAYYAEDNPGGLYSGSSLGVDINHISACEYWMLNRTGGSSNVAVTLSWNSNSCGVDNLCDLRVAQWDGAQWISAGNGGANGTNTSGTLVSGTNCSVPEFITSFSPFTLASFSFDNNPLPIRLISFEASVCESSVCLAWQTASESNNDFFTVEKSNDGLIWEGFEDIKGAGNSQTILKYKTIDKSPFSGLSYYRLKQTDFNGEFEYSSIELIYLENPNNQGLTIYPNPASDIVTINGLSSEVDLKIYNSMGQDITSSVLIIQSVESSIQLDISLLTTGIYYIKTTNNYSSIIKH